MSVCLCVYVHERRYQQRSEASDRLELQLWAIVNTTPIVNRHFKQAKKKKGRKEETLERGQLNKMGFTESHYCGEHMMPWPLQLDPV